MANKMRDAFLSKAYKYQKKLYNYACRLCKSSALAEDVLQETWIRVLKYWDSYTDQHKLDHWLYRIVTRVWLDQCNLIGKEAYRLKAHALDIPSVSIGSSDTMRTAYDDSYSDAVIQILGNLTPSHRQILILAARYETETCANIAKVLKIPKGTVMSRLFRARDACKQLAKNRPDLGSVLASQHDRTKKNRALDQRAIRKSSR